MFEQFIQKNFRAESLAAVDTALGIIGEYQADGYTLTLRQLYYQFVARGLIENSERSYKNLGGLITDARMAGLLPWDGIEDRGRSRQTWLVQEDVDEILGNLRRSYAADMWDSQPYYIEVWVEKEALSNVVERACQTRRVPYMACKGYLSASEAWRAGKRFEEARERGQHPVVIHLGDHDPSGIDMTRDNGDRLALFSQGDIEVSRIALNRDQIDHYRPPPNPAKITDSRAEDYIRRHGTTSWELDALEPQVVVRLIENEIEPYIDQENWDQARQRETEMQSLLGKVHGRWDDIRRMLDGSGENV